MPLVMDAMGAPSFTSARYFMLSFRKLSYSVGDLSQPKCPTVWKGSPARPIKSSRVITPRPAPISRSRSTGASRCRPHGRVGGNQPVHIAHAPDRRARPSATHQLKAREKSVPLITDIYLCPNARKRRMPPTPELLCTCLCRRSHADDV